MAHANILSSSGQLLEHQPEKMGLQKLLFLKEGRYGDADSFYRGRPAFLLVPHPGPGFLRARGAIGRFL